MEEGVYIVRYKGEVQLARWSNDPIEIADSPNETIGYWTIVQSKDIALPNEVEVLKGPLQ
ncbi:Uncharacterised protein [Kluyvera cryocrescens]|uniref:Uncharacterized protein n=1 Tax=Kluyvera cryocrescens TaxID=580 RepID=A0A485CX77_KLUCR|nr:Uncharacterised protein [Kluyvera cryocrescens]